MSPAATQEPAKKETNGIQANVMTPQSLDQGAGDANRTNASKTDSAQQKAAITQQANGDGKSPKKRRKVNHACIYCRRSHMTCDLERPCARCIKRNIGHLCHDEPREPAKRTKADMEHANGGNGPSNLDPSRTDAALSQPNPHEAGLNLAPPSLPQNRLDNTTVIAQPTPVSAPHVSPMTSDNQSFLNYNDFQLAPHNHFHDMHTFHPSFMFSNQEANAEFHLINDFLNNSLLDEGSGALFNAQDDVQGLFSDPSLTSGMGTLPQNASLYSASQQNNQLLPPSQAAAGNAISRPASGFPLDKAQETYYMTAADPAGNDTPEARMNKLLKAKYDAGMLKPFNYVKGYARLNVYMERNMQPVSRQKILRQLDKFRPKFRERMQSLTDIELVRVEMWFERSLMEYDRVFASMAIPACCWRRTGEIFRGNKEMAELINVPIEKLRDGKLAIHEIIAEDSLVSYWEKFGAIAFDSSQKAILTSCSLKNPDPNSKEPEIRCCFSFTIRRDTHYIPSLIVGNFLPILPDKR